MGFLMTYRAWSDEALLAANEPGTAGPSFATFYDRYERAVAAFHMRRCGSAHEAADRTAETFARALEGRGRFVADGSDAGVRWLFGIARNVGLEHSRAAGRELSCTARLGFERQPLSPAIAERLTGLVEDEGLARALSHLPRRHRRAVIARIVEEVPYSELADELETTELAVRQRVSRGLTALRQAIKETP